MLFGIRRRICIRNKFVLMETKVMLFHLLWRCEPDVKTKIPVVFSKKKIHHDFGQRFLVEITSKKIEESCIYTILIKRAQS